MAPTVYMSEQSDDDVPSRHLAARRQQENNEANSPSSGAANPDYQAALDEEVRRRRSTGRVTRSQARRVRRDQRTRRNSSFLSNSRRTIGGSQSIVHELQPDITSDASCPDDDSSDDNSSNGGSVSNTSSRSGSICNSPSPLDNSPGFESPEEFPSESNDDDFMPSDKSLNQRLVCLRRREGLLNIAVRTMALIWKNHQFQLELAKLEADTRAFVRSVLNNPENQGLQLTTATMLVDKQNDSKSSDESSNPAMELDEQESEVSDSGESSVEK